MATVTGLTAERMLAIEGSSIVDGFVDNDGNLILKKYSGQTINAGAAIGPKSVYPEASTAVVRTSDGRAKTAPPTDVDDAATKKYVDDLDAAQKTYVDSATKANKDYMTDGTQTITVSKVRLKATGDASATSTGHAFQIGDDTGANLIIDQNELQARNNGVGKVLYIEYGANASTTAYVPTGAGDFTTKDYTDKLAASSIFGKEIAANTNLNTLTIPGTYKQSLTANATTALNYPQAIGGLLEVFANDGVQNTMYWQRYTPYGSGNGMFYTRAHYNGTWYAWIANNRPDEVVTPIATIGNFTTSGQINVEYLPSGKKRITLQVTFTRVNSNFGTVGQVWTSLGTFIPSGSARITVPFSNVYTNGWLSTAGTTQPISLSIDMAGGVISFRSMTGVASPTMNVNDYFNVYLTVVEK